MELFAVPCRNKWLVVVVAMIVGASWGGWYREPTLQIASVLLQSMRVYRDMIQSSDPLSCETKTSVNQTDVTWRFVVLTDTREFGVMTFACGLWRNVVVCVGLMGAWWVNKSPIQPFWLYCMCVRAKSTKSSNKKKGLQVCCCVSTWGRFTVQMQSPA